MANIINEWFIKKTKIHNKSDLKILNNYLRKMDNKIKTKNIIEFSYDYKFRYYDYDVENIRPENIFKLNWYHIIKKCKKFFDNIKIDIKFEKSSLTEREIKMLRATYKHDVYITIMNKTTNTIFDCVIEYFENGSHNRKIDIDKEIGTKQFVDLYAVYKERENLNIFMKTTLHKILMLICTANNDPYTLAKINFFNNYENENKLILQLDTIIFNRILKYKKTNIFDLQDFFGDINPQNSDSGEYFEYDDFIEFLEDTYSINIDTNNINSYNLFVDIIIKIDSQTESPRLLNYKKNYARAMNMLFVAQEQIISFIRDINDRKNGLPKFIDYFLLNHLINYKDKETLKQVKKIFMEQNILAIV